MKVLVDTCIWSLALRRAAVSRDTDAVVLELRELINSGSVQVVGPIRQEILSGIGDHKQFVELRDHLREFPDMEITSLDHELAAEMFNKLRAKGIQGSNTDYLLCALSQRHGMPIYTEDADFTLYKKHLSIKRHHSRKHTGS